MGDIDLNLLPALDALLFENSVTGAARRLGLSPSAMSRTLARLRAATGDPLLVRAGRGLVPTPRAEALRDRVHALAGEARGVLRPAPAELDLAALTRIFTIRVNEGFMESLAGPLLAAVTAAAPRLRLRFAPKPDKDAGPIRDGSVDLEIGVLGTDAPEVRAQTLFRDGFVGVVRLDHPLLGEPVTPERYAACRHVVASRHGRFEGPVDDALGVLGLERTIVAVVPGYPDAIRMARRSDLVALVPHSCLGGEAADHDGAARGVRAFALPVRTPDIAILGDLAPPAWTATRFTAGCDRPCCRCAGRPGSRDEAIIRRSGPARARRPHPKRLGDRPGSNEDEGVFKAFDTGVRKVMSGSRPTGWATCCGRGASAGRRSSATRMKDREDPTPRESIRALRTSGSHFCGISNSTFVHTLLAKCAAPVDTPAHT